MADHAMLLCRFQHHISAERLRFTDVRTTEKVTRESSGRGHRIGAARGHAGNEEVEDNHNRLLLESIIANWREDQLPSHKVVRALLDARDGIIWEDHVRRGLADAEQAL